MTIPVHSSARRGLAAVAVSGLMAAGLSTLNAAPAQSAPDTQCPTAVPVSQLAEGDAVTGRTVTKGTTPTDFTGQIQGVLEDGIAPGVDMILADVHSETIDRIGGIWQGMSGSPVYDADGGLVGAVAYSLGESPSTIVGITPASEMAKLLDDANLSDHDAELPSQVALPRSVARRLVASKAASSAQATSGLRQLRLPISISGLGSTRLAKVAPKLHVSGGRVVAGAGGSASGEQIPIEAGGNMAAGVSYGTVTAAALGTATVVCGDGAATKIVGFGHPMEYSGASTKTLHGARAILIQDDASAGSFKLANIGAPIGTVDQDRRAGIRGVPGELPTATSVTTTSKVANREAQGTTQVNFLDAVPELSFMHVATIQDKALDRSGKGRARATWTIQGTRANGSPFSLTRSDLFASRGDISSTTADAIATDVDTIANNGEEQVKLTEVKVDSSLSDAYATYAIARVQVYSLSRWVTPQRNRATAVRAGYLIPVRLTLTSAEGPAKTVQISVRVPKGAKNRTGVLGVVGNAESDEEGFFEDEDEDFGYIGFDEDDEEYGFSGPEAPSAANFSKLLARMKARPTQDQVDVTMRFRAPSPVGNLVKSSAKTSQVVTGSGAFPIIAR